ncbi:hypothetical protein WI91_11635 [Burkholderia vietnamiensis]|uniref:Uncharacterized protein n=2 Tax=Burkholderia cepacia complex TaxID=87882 RepID=A0AA45BGM7_BURVI|nr:hypothetical protein WJ35_28830 [Burkholderia ubonensis]AOJ99358.1 hypothetical protein WK23_12370 [Burkholderia vietnamiensis]AOK11743.1 hypothetical protein WK31_15455 [Burkholderia vietnamiensis]AOK44211.1 hypothetical protein WL96_24655 [Burkholderia vietnamiensis]AVR13140.1 hypothetical protein A8H33_06710 [Burkholderia vietnamiensis]
MAFWSCDGGSESDVGGVRAGVVRARTGRDAGAMARIGPCRDSACRALVMRGAESSLGSADDVAMMRK